MQGNVCFRGCVGKHARFEQKVFIVDIDPDFDDAAFWVELRVDKGDAPVEGFSGYGFDGERDFLGVTQPWEVRFVGLHFEPDRAELGDAKERVAGFKILALFGVEFDNDAVLLCRQGDLITWFALCFDGGNLLLGEF